MNRSNEEQGDSRRNDTPSSGGDRSIHDAGSRVRGALDELEASAELHEIREHFGDVLDGAARFIRANPAASLLIAAGVGYLIGRIVRS